MGSFDEKADTSSEYDNGDIFDSDDGKEYSSKESSSDESNSSEDDGSEESDDSEEDCDPWEELIQEAAADLRTEYHELIESFKNDGLSETEAKKQAFSEVLPKLRQE